MSREIFGRRLKIYATTCIATTTAQSGHPFNDCEGENFLLKSLKNFIFSGSQMNGKVVVKCIFSYQRTQETFLKRWMYATPIVHGLFIANFHFGKW